MSISLDPVVAKKLQQFGRRRMWLIVARGLCAGLVTFLISVAIVAAIDWYWLLSDRVRWSLSLAIYLPVIFVVWMTCLRKIFHRPLREEIASQVELSEPQLRENLLSAVELAADDPSVLHDSPVFRSLLQEKVAVQMSRLQVPSILPMKLVAGWALSAAVVIMVALLLLTSDDGRFRQLAARAILPGANIARVSRIQVEILQPTPHSLMLAEDETVAIVVAVSGGHVNDVILETFTAKHGAVRQSMQGRTESEFAANVHVLNESVEYRVLAGDAVTQRFRIESRPRPRVTMFQKHYQYPEYSLLPAETVKETHGDLLVLQGTTAALSLELDQQVSSAELRIDPADSDELLTIPLAVDPDFQDGLHWTATVQVDQEAIYKVHLVSKETGFENLFSPKYEIRPQPDLIPRTGFLEQQETTLLLPPNDILGLKAMAEDDLPLVSLEQQVSVNGRDWLSLPLDTKAADGGDGRQVTAAWQWDLLNHRLKTGDQITTRLVATDRKGNIGESVPLRIIVAASDFDPARHAVMQRKVRLVDALSAFSALMQEHKVSSLEAIERLRNPEAAADQAAQDRSLLADIARRQREQAAELLVTVSEVQKEMPPGADAYELELAGRIIARLQKEHSGTPVFLVEVLQSASYPKRLKTDLDEVKRTFERVADDAKNVAEQYQALAAHNFLASVAFDMDALLRQQSIVVNSPTQTWDRLLRQETLVVNQLKVLERLVQEERKRMPGFLDGHLKNLLSWSLAQRERLQDSMESEDKLDQLKSVSQDLLRQLQDRQRYDSIDGGLPGRIASAWRDFENRSGSLYVPIDQIARTIQQENQLTAQAANSTDSVESRKLLDQAARFVFEVDLKLRRSLEQLRTRRELTQGRKDADSQYAADLGLTHRATMSLLSQHRQVSPQESEISAQLLEIAPAYRILEAGHEVVQLNQLLSVLQNMERWDSQNLQAHIDHPRQWDLVQRNFELASQRLREAGVKNEIAGALDQVRWSTAVREAGRRISDRRWRRDAMIGAGHELTEIRNSLSTVLEDLQPVMAEARAIIAKYSPTIPQMAQQTADQLRQMEEATTAAADAAEEPQSPESDNSLSEKSKSPPAVSELSALREQQKRINEQIADLMEALVEDANSQNMLEESQRERARDADDSIAMIQEPAAEMNRAMEKAQENSAPQQQAQNLAQAAEQQEKTAQALDLVAKHFGQLDQGLDVAESRAELRAAEREMGISRQLEEQYKSAEELSQMAAQDPQQLMAELEAELQQNPAMQQALSEISKKTLEEARNALQFAAQDDQAIQQANERSDSDFQAKKRELAEDIRNMGAEASRLSGALVAQANQSAAQGKTTEAQKKFAEAQQKLNEVAAKANSAREDQLLPEIAQTAQEAKAALAEAAEMLVQGKQLAQTGRDEKIHADDKAREAAQKDAEKRRQQYHDQQKKVAADLAKRAGETKKRAEQAVQNAERDLAKAETRLQQARQKLDAKPDDAGLKNALQQEMIRQATEQKKVTAAKRGLERADQQFQSENQRVEAANSRQQPALDAANPSTQLADQLAEEAIKAAEQLKQNADHLIAAADFGKQLTPTRDQLNASEQQQQLVTQDVSQVAEDVARAARHERRLNNANAADPLQEAARSIQQTANNEVIGAAQQLQTAAKEAEQAESNAAANPQANTPRPNGQALQAQQQLENSETALAQQAQRLSEVVEPLLASADADADSEDGMASEKPENAGIPGSSQSGAEQNNSPPGDAPNASPAAEADPRGAGHPNVARQPGSASSPERGNPTPAALAPEQLARAQQLARTLDELDRQQAGTAANKVPQPDSSSPPMSAPQSELNTLAQAAGTQQATQSASRIKAQQEAVLAMSEGGLQSSDAATSEAAVTEFRVTTVNRNEAEDWGKLRSQAAEEISKGRSEAVAEEYRRSVETYFKVLAERARRKK